MKEARAFNFDLGWSGQPNDVDEAAAQTPTLTGLAADTVIATARGWRPAGTVEPGDLVLTFDGGLQTVTKVTRDAFWDQDGPCPEQFWPIEVPAGVMGNRDVMRLLPHQTVMVESDTAEDLYGDPFSLIQAEAMDEVTGAHRAPPQDGFEVIRLHFVSDQVVFAKSGMLFLCPSCRDMLDCVVEEQNDPIYAILPMDEARFLAIMIEEETADAVAAGRDDQMGILEGLPA